MSAYPAGFDEKGFEECQKKILEINETHQKTVSKLEIERDVASNAVYAARSSLIKEKGPKDFWAQVILAHKEMASDLLGDYDRKILQHLTDFNVTFRADGAIRIEFTFAKNEFFKEEKLWAEEDSDRQITFSGIEWNEGHGPLTAEEEAARSGDDKLGDKRPRDEIAGNPNRGQTMFQFFSKVPLDPLDVIPDSSELNDEEVEDILEDFRDMLDDRKELFRALVEEIWSYPSKILKSGSVV